MTATAESPLTALAKSSRNSALLSFLGLAILFGSLTFAAGRIGSAEQLVRERAAEAERLRRELQATQGEFEKKRSALAALQDSERQLKATIAALTTEQQRKSKEIAEAQALLDEVRARVPSSDSVKIEKAQERLESARETSGNGQSRIYLHVGSEAQRALVQTKGILSKFRSDGFLVLGVENVAGKANIPQRLTNVRFFHDQDEPSAKRVVGLLLDAGISAVPIRVQALRARTGTIEVWFSSNLVR